MSALPELPDWVKSLGLPKVATDAIARFWKPVWDEIKPQLELLPDHRARTPALPPAPDGAWFAFEVIEELEPGERWRASHEAMWPAFRAWYLKEGDSARPDLATCRHMLAEHMPELVPTYETLVELAGGDELAARFLSLYRPPGFVVGCAVVTACLSPDRKPEFSAVPAATNHQREDDWPDYARAVRTFERERYVLELLDEPEMTPERFVQSFLEPPLYSTAFSRGFGTIYTTAYFPVEGRAE
jgi:hypothetical protein